MKLVTSLLVATSALAASIASHQRGRSGPAQVATLQRGTQTLIFKEINGVPGNECLTFRNNGEIVDAACVNTAADRQITPSTIGTVDVLLVQRSFTAGFRADLVNVQACVGFNGTDFKAVDCTSATFEAVSFQNGQMISKSGACQSGHDDKAQVTVDASGKTCAKFTSTAVTATAP